MKLDYFSHLKAYRRLESYVWISKSLPIIYITHFTRLEKLRVLQLDDDVQNSDV